MNITHLDLKLENLVVNCIDDDHIQLKLIDFGGAVKGLNELNEFKTHTLNFASPEIALKADKLYVFITFFLKFNNLKFYFFCINEVTIKPTRSRLELFVH